MQSMDSAGRIIYINTFSRTIAPALRISYMILPAALVDQWRRKMGFYNCTVSSFDQLTLTRFIEGGYFERHINRLKKHYHNTLENLRSVCEKEEYRDFCTIANGNAGLNFLVKFNTDADDAELRKALENYFQSHQHFSF